MGLVKLKRPSRHLIFRRPCFWMTKVATGDDHCGLVNLDCTVVPKWRAKRESLHTGISAHWKKFCCVWREKSSGQQQMLPQYCACVAVPWMLCILQRLPCSIFKLNTRCRCPRPVEATAGDQEVVYPVHGVALHRDGQGVQAALVVGRPKLHKVHRHNAGVEKATRKKKTLLSFIAVTKDEMASN